MSKTQELEKRDSKDTDETPKVGQETDDIPSWSEIFGRSSDVGIKKSVLGYSLASVAIFAASAYFLPVTIGFTVALLIVSLLTGFIGKADLAGASITGAVGGAVASIFTAGIAALTVAPVLTGAVAGLIAGGAGVLVGGWIRSKIGSGD